MARKKVLPIFSFFTALLASGLILLATSFPPFDMIERRFLDLSFQIRGSENPHPDIVIIDIDDQSLLKVGSWPWPRSIYSDLLKVLAAYKPSVVFYDMIFSEQSNAEDDQTFAEEIKNAGNIVLPFYFSGRKLEEFSERSAVFPIPLFRDHTREIGYVNVIPNVDGHIREFIPTVSGFHHASLATALLHLGNQGKEAKAFPNSKSVLINFPGPYSVFRRVSFDQLIEHYESPQVQSFLRSLQNKILLIGHTATGASMDLKPIAFSPQYPGVALQASMLHTILSGKFLERLPLPLHFLLLFLFVLLILRLSSVENPLEGLFRASASLLLLFGAVQLVFQHFRLWIPYFGFLMIGSGSFVAMMLVKFVQIRIEREIFSRELTLASRIQKSFLPAEIPSIPGLQIAAVSLPARHVGGDFYDVLSLPDGKCGICVGDVSGKGIPAALFMAKAISEFRREADSSMPSAVMKRLNTKIASEQSSGLFLTLLYLILDPRAGRFSFSNGGHEPIFFYEKACHSVQLLFTKKGIPLGVDLEGSFDEREEMIAKGDILLLQSDGVKEAMNSKREIFGVERIKSVLSESASLTPAVLIDRFLERIRDFTQDAPQHDDLTIVCAKFS